jgi:hypothetical protein
MKITNPYVCNNCNRIVSLKQKRNSDLIYKVCKKCGEYPVRIITLKGKEVMSMVKEHKWIGISELAELVNRSVSMIRYWVNRGTLPYNKINGRVMFMDNDIKAIQIFVKMNGRKRGVKTGTKIKTEVTNNG